LASLVALCCSFSLPGVRAQVFDFADVPAPGSHTLQTHYYFHVRAPQGPGQDIEPAATVHFKNLRLVANQNDPKPPSAQSIVEYKGVQVSVSLDEDFKAAMDPTHFCSRAADVSTGAAKAEGQLVLKIQGSDVASFIVSGDSGSSEQLLRKSGLYVLVLTNCGDMDGISVLGSVEVKNAWGFLPAIDRGKQALYGFVVAFYLSVGVIWTLLCLRWWKSLLHVQKGILLTISFCISESVAWWCFFQVRNSTGGFPPFVFLLATLSSIWKTVAGFYAIMTDPSRGAEDAGISVQTHALLMLYLVLQFHLKVIMSFRHGFALTLTTVLLSALPVFVVGAIMLVSVYHKVNSFVEMLQGEKAEHKILLYQRLQGLVLFAGFFLSIAVVLEIFDPTTADMATWDFHFVVSDGIPQGSFACVLLAAMFFACPSQDMQGYEYVQQSQDGAVIGAPSTIWDDTDCEEDVGSIKHENGDRLVQVE